MDGTGSSTTASVATPLQRHDERQLQTQGLEAFMANMNKNSPPGPCEVKWTQAGYDDFRNGLGGTLNWEGDVSLEKGPNHHFLAAKPGDQLRKIYTLPKGIELVSFYFQFLELDVKRERFSLCVLLCVLP